MIERLEPHSTMYLEKRFIDAVNEILPSMDDLTEIAKVDSAKSLGPVISGKFAIQDDAPVIAFGKKHRGKPIYQVALEDRGYLKNFMQRGNFSEPVKEIARRAAGITRAITRARLFRTQQK